MLINSVKKALVSLQKTSAKVEDVMG